VSIVLGVVFLDESVGLLALAGSAVAVVGAWQVNRS
jgi:drug/metabolite transporter (DMT)-like permease